MMRTRDPWLPWLMAAAFLCILAVLLLAGCGSPEWEDESLPTAERVGYVHEAELGDAATTALVMEILWSDMTEDERQSVCQGYRIIGAGGVQASVQQHGGEVDGMDAAALQAWLADTCNNGVVVP